MPNLDLTDPTFKQDLADSIQYVWKAAKLFSDKGYDVNIPTTHVRPDASQAAEYSDKGDLHISFPVQVKHRKGLVFTDRASFPFPTVIVDVCHSWDKHKVKPFCYIIYNEAGTHYIIIMGNTSKQWLKTKKYDSHANRERSYYECPIHLVNFIKA
jgi:hypothetical protein